MELAKLTVIALVLVARTCRGEIVIGTSTPDKSTARLVDDLVNIVTSCYKGQIDHGVGLAGNLPSTLTRRLSVEHSIPVALIENVWNFNDKILPPDLQFRHKLNVFIIEASSFAELDVLVQMNIQKSIWWNHMASFFILDLSPGCINAIAYLDLAWQTDLLNAKVMCSHHKSGRIIYNYNPFTNQAPIPWKWVAVIPRYRKRKEKAHPFFVFSRNYHENQSVCVDLDFDRTQDVGGYEIRLQGFPYENSEDLKRCGHAEYAFRTRRKRMMTTIFRALNATSRIYDEVKWNNVRNDNHMSNKESWWLWTWSVKHRMATYPHRQVDESIVTQFRGNSLQLSKVVDIFDTGSLFGTFAVYMTTIIFFKFFVRQALGPALINLIRMTCGMGLRNLPDNTVSRVYLASLLLFALVVQAVFQSDTASLLSTQTPLPNADSIRDLEDLGYNQICARAAQRNLLEDSALKMKFIASDESDCITRVKNNSLVAGILVVESRPFEMVQKFNLRVSAKPTRSFYYTFNIQWNYPLTERINKIIARMVEASVLEPWDVKCRPVKISELYDSSTNSNNFDFKILNLQDMTFSFVILGIGLSCATVAFIMEVAVGFYNIRYSCGIKIKVRMWCHMVPASRRDSIGTEVTVGRVQID